PSRAGCCRRGSTSRCCSARRAPSRRSASAAAGPRSSWTWPRGSTPRQGGPGPDGPPGSRRGGINPGIPTHEGLPMTRDQQTGDPLGKLAARYDTKKATLYLIAGAVLGLLGAVLFFLRDPIARATLDNPQPALYGWLGGVLAAVGVGLAAVSL